MRRLFLSLIAVLCLALPGDCQQPSSVPATWAVIRIPSHGASATVIWTGDGQSWILGCAHAYEGASRTKPMTFDMPAPEGGQPKPARSHLMACDYGLDLTLVKIDAGPLPYVCHVADPGTRPGRNVLSAGYDDMKMPATVRTATITGTSGTTTWTRERPWHGRSGGALIDADAGRLIGVVQGYTGPKSRAEVVPGANGMYVSHATIINFMRKAGFRFGNEQPTLPQVDPFRQEFRPAPVPRPTLPQQCPS